MDNIKVSTDRGTFKLVKDYEKYSSYWVCTGGYCPGFLSQENAGMIVPMAYRADLYKLARSAGYSPDDLAAPKRPEKTAPSGRTRKVGVKKAGIRISLKDRLKGKIRVAAASTEDN